MQEKENFRIGSRKWSAEMPGDLKHVDLVVLAQELRSEGKVIYLSPNEFQIVWLLNRANGNFVTEAEITEFLYEDSDDDLPLSNVVASLVVRIRNKIRNEGLHLNVGFQRGFVYRLERIEEIKD